MGGFYYFFSLFSLQIKSSNEYFYFIVWVVSFYTIVWESFSSSLGEGFFSSLLGRVFYICYRILCHLLCHHKRAFLLFVTWGNILFHYRIRGFSLHYYMSGFSFLPFKGLRIMFFQHWHQLLIKEVVHYINHLSKHVSSVSDVRPYTILITFLA